MAEVKSIKETAWYYKEEKDRAYEVQKERVEKIQKAYLRVKKAAFLLYPFFNIKGTKLMDFFHKKIIKHYNSHLKKENKIYKEKIDFLLEIRKFHDTVVRKQLEQEKHLPGYNEDLEGLEQIISCLDDTVGLYRKVMDRKAR